METTKRTKRLNYRRYTELLAKMETGEFLQVGDIKVEVARSSDIDFAHDAYYVYASKHSASGFRRPLEEAARALALGKLGAK